MKNIFFIGALVGCALAVLGFFAWKLIQSIYSHVHDTRVVRDTKIASKMLREKKQKENAERLDNGCEHRFGEKLGGFPPFACRACGLEENKPAGDCDHVWRLATDSSPGAVCELCQKRYRPKVSQSTGFGN